MMSNEATPLLRKGAVVQEQQKQQQGRRFGRVARVVLAGVAAVAGVCAVAASYSTGDTTALLGLSLSESTSFAKLVRWDGTPVKVAEVVEATTPQPLIDAADIKPTNPIKEEEEPAAMAGSAAPGIDDPEAVVEQEKASLLGEGDKHHHVICETHNDCEEGQFCSTGMHCDVCDECHFNDDSFDDACPIDRCPLGATAEHIGELGPAAAPGYAPQFVEDKSCGAHDDCKAGEFCYGSSDEVTDGGQCSVCSECEYDIDAVNGVCPVARCPGTPTKGLSMADFEAAGKEAASGPASEAASGPASGPESAPTS